MGLAVSLALILVPLLALLAIGQPVAFAMATVGILVAYLVVGSHFVITFGWVIWNAANSFILVAVPLYILMGEVLLRIGITARLYSGLTPWVGRLPGGLLHSNIGACAIFAAVSGSSVATAATIGTVAIPELEKRGYGGSVVAGSLAAGGTLGILIPPSINMIIYGAMVGESVGQLFIGGMIPGIVMALLFMLYIASSASLQPGRLAPEVIRAPWRARFSGLKSIAPSLFLIFIVLGTIYLGVATPTEAAAMGAVGAMLLGLAYRSLGWQTLKESVLTATRTSCAVIFIYIAAQTVNLIVAELGVPRKIVDFVISLPLSPLGIMIAIYVLYLIMGCFFEGFSIMVLSLPVLYPVVIALGFDSVWFGIVLVILIEAGFLTPPVGINLFVIQRIAPQYSFGTIVRGVAPFFLIQLLIIVLVTAFPSMALWLPAQMITR